MNKFTVIFILFFVFSMLAGCASHKVTASEHTTDVQRHTEYVLKTDTFLKHDSIRVHDSIFVSVVGDTITKYKYHTEYRDRIVYSNRIDTVCRVDTIINSFVDTQYIEKELSFTDKLRIKVADFCFLFFIVLFIVLIIKFFILKK